MCVNESANQFRLKEFLANETLEWSWSKTAVSFTAARGGPTRPSVSKFELSQLSITQFVNFRSE